ncbi:MAG: DUF1127 domain-containing protein [Alphaproteobacteria bacterium]
MKTLPINDRRAAGPGSAAAASGLQGAFAALATAGRHLEEWRRRARGRHQLMTLGDDLLKDIGLGRSEAFGEYSKPFWHR